MLVAPAVGPRSIPANTTSMGCSVNGTGVPGIGSTICDAAATAAANPTMPKAVTVAERWRGRASVIMRDCSLVDASNAECHGIAAAEAQRGQPALQPSVLQCVKQRREYTRPARADRVTERDRAAVDVDAIPIPLQ